MNKEYDTFVSDIGELAVGQEIELVIRDLAPGPRQYDSCWVKAVVANLPASMPDGDVLWVRFPLGFLHPEPYAVKVVEVLGEYRPRQQKGSRPGQVYEYSTSL
ncbi:MAG: phenylphosphate carboxylase subunit gamma [Desulfobacterales bacterium]|nr:phenylphosphate carboxylase subunit gamma [Desulfobacterales bacterium]